jgi:hypothetical protein
LEKKKSLHNVPEVEWIGGAKFVVESQERMSKEEAVEGIWEEKKSEKQNVTVFKEEDTYISSSAKAQLEERIEKHLKEKEAALEKRKDTEDQENYFNMINQLKEVWFEH